MAVVTDAQRLVCRILVRATIFSMLQSRAVRCAVIVLLIAAVAIALTPALASAQTIPTIVPDNCRGADAAKNCGFCDIGELAQNTINAGIYIAVFLSALLFAWAGWLYMTAGGEPGKASQARQIFWNVGVGLAIILAAWLIVDLIMKMLISEEALFGPWNEIC